MVGIIFAILSGFFIALQNVLNATIGTEVSIWSTAMLTQAVGGTGALIIYFLSKGDGFGQMKQVKPIYLFGGSFGALVVAAGVVAVMYIGAAVTNASMLLAQLATVVLIETFGFFHMKKQPIARKQIIGLAVMMVGAILISL
ncbi:MAG: DMT family transporter [Solibacillus sp.]